MGARFAIDRGGGRRVGITWHCPTYVNLGEKFIVYYSALAKYRSTRYQSAKA